MIQITEKLATKVPGKTSLYLTIHNTDYERVRLIISIITQLEVYSYKKKDKEYEIPLTSLSYLIRELNEHDDIQLNLLKDDICIDNINTLLTQSKLSLFEHQKEGVLFGLNHDKFLLLDEPGLGKTAQIINLANELRVRENLEHCFIICGVNSLKNNWKNEIHKHSDLSCRILGERINKNGKVTYATIHERALELKNKIDEFFIVTNIETLRSADALEAFNKSANKIDMIVIDEIHCCASWKSLQGKNILKLNAKHMIGLTGTLITNSPLSTYVPLTFIKANNSTVTNFKNYYCTYGGFHNVELLGYKNLDFLKDAVAENSLRRDKSLLNLPEKNIITEIIDMNDSQRDFYNNIVSGITSEMDKVTSSTANVLASVVRLRQATACPTALTTLDVASSKLERTCDLVRQIVSTNNKVVIFSTYKESVYQLRNMLSDLNSYVITGDVDDALVSKYVNEFQTKDDVKVLIATWQKLGTGQTLNAASYMIFIDTPFTYSGFNQCCDRIHRIGTKRPVFIYNLICKDTIDERVNELVNIKEALGDYIVDDKLSDKSVEILRKYIENLV